MGDSEKNKTTPAPKVDVLDLDARDAEKERVATAADLARFLDVSLDEEPDKTPDAEEADEVEDAEEAEEAEDSEEPEEGEAEEVEEDEAEEPAVEPAEAVPPEKSEGKVQFTSEQQAIIEAMVLDRLARDRKVKGVRELEALTGQDLDEVLLDLRQQKIDKAASEYGMTEEEAKRHILAEERVRFLEAQNAQNEQEQARTKEVAKYQTAKARYASNPYAKRYDREVEKLTRGGDALDYDAGLRYVIGDKFLDGDLKDFVADTTEKRTLANVAKRSKTRVEGGGQSPRAPESRLGGTERTFARILLDDVTDKPELAYSKAKPKKG